MQDLKSCNRCETKKFIETQDGSDVIQLIILTNRIETSSYFKKYLMPVVPNSVLSQKNGVGLYSIHQTKGQAEHNSKKLNPTSTDCCWTGIGNRVRNGSGIRNFLSAKYFEELLSKFGPNNTV